MENFNNYYLDRYLQSQDRISEMSYQVGWLQGSIRKLQRLVDDGIVEVKSGYESLLDSVLNSIEEAEKFAAGMSVKTEVVAEQ
jgi:hypothetical protein